MFTFKLDSNNSLSSFSEDKFAFWAKFWIQNDIMYKGNLKKKVYFLHSETMPDLHSECCNPQCNHNYTNNPFLLQSWLLWHNTLSFPLRVRLHNLGATRCSPTEKWDCSQMFQASWSVCRSGFSFSSPTQCVPQEVALIMFYNTKVHSKFKEHVSHIQAKPVVWLAY